MANSRRVLFVCGSLAIVNAGVLGQSLEPLLPAGGGPTNMAFDSARGRTVLFASRETWECDGLDWRRVATAATPSSIVGHGLVFDSWRNRAVLFGGYTAIAAGAVTGATWEYDGVGWTQVASGPAPRVGHAMAFDAARGRTVLFGGANASGAELQDTWEFDGQSWTQASPAHAPSVRRGAAMAAGLGTCLLYGGSRGFGISYADTWTWNGVDWQLRTPLASPGQRGEAAMAFDAARSRFVLTGGRWRNGLAWALLGNTWEFDGTNWSEVPNAGLLPREDHAMAFDLAHGRMLLRGGSFEQPLALLGYTGVRWDPVHGLQPPPARSDFSVVYDVHRDQTIHFGGLDAPALAFSAETWALTGRRWTQLQPANSPPARRRAAMAYDARRQRVVLFGGDAGASLFGDTWIFDGADWTQLATPVAPSPRMHGSMVHDAARDVLVMHGGLDHGQGMASDTWELRGNTWVQTIPLGIVYGNESTLVFDRRRDRVLRIGGETYPWTHEYTGSGFVVASVHAWQDYGTSAAFDAGRGRTVAVAGRIHEFDGTTWTTHATPAITDLGKVVYDDARGAVVRVARNGATAVVSLPGGAAWSRIGPGCAGSAGVPLLTATPPVLGSTMQVTLSNLPVSAGLAHLGAGFYATHWAGLPLPVDLALFGMSGCTLWIDSQGAFGTWLVPAGGLATLSLTIPNVPAFAGLRIFHQGSVLDASTPGGLVVSDAGVGTIR